ncbi:hypothetical protein NC652_025054 [Populus alba x Populus x berolinensis]|nr:hypothetical protein NC652_025054 [Populus alba x Populus x berolinensis]
MVYLRQKRPREAFSPCGKTRRLRSLSCIWCVLLALIKEAGIMLNKISKEKYDNLPQGLASALGY